MVLAWGRVHIPRLRPVHWEATRVAQRSQLKRQRQSGREIVCASGEEQILGCEMKGALVFCFTYVVRFVPDEAELLEHEVGMI